MRICIVGGKLQGIEAAYLSRKAGYECVLIDRNPRAPALSLADESHVFDVTRDVAKAREIYKSADVILPATENQETLKRLSKDAKVTRIPFIHDDKAFHISRSKIRSNELFKELGVPMPLLYPKAKFPLVIKPSEASGSFGVTVALNAVDLRRKLMELRQFAPKIVVQEFIRGPSISIEVIAKNGVGQSLLCTLLEFDSNYDCKRVIVPTYLGSSVEDKFRSISMRIAEGLHLTGITDVEAMVYHREPMVIEIDARLPSQTPSAVYHSCGINMLKLLVDMFVHGYIPKIKAEPENSIIYEHIAVSNAAIRVVGEHVMADAGNLRVHEKFFGTDEMLTDFDGVKTQWVAILIVKERSIEKAWNKRNRVLHKILGELNIERFSDPFPVVGIG